MQNIKIPAIGVLIEDRKDLRCLLSNNKNDGVMIAFRWDIELFKYLCENIDIRSELFIVCIFDYVSKEILDMVKSSKVKYLDIAMITKVVSIKDRCEDLKMLSSYEKDEVVRCVATFNVSLLQVSLLIEQSSVTPALSVLELHPNLAQVFGQDYLSDLGITLGGYRLFSRIDELKEVDQIAKRLNTNSQTVLAKWLHQRHIFNFIDFVDYQNYFESIDLEDVKLKLSDVEKINSLSSGLKLYTDPENVC